jgi:hypothetical protein
MMPSLYVDDIRLGGTCLFGWIVSLWVDIVSLSELCPVGVFYNLDRILSLGVNHIYKAGPPLVNPVSLVGF